MLMIPQAFYRLKSSGVTCRAKLRDYIMNVINFILTRVGAGVYIQRELFT